MRRDEGSIFLEALVATAIVATVLGVLFSVMSQASVRHRDVASRRTALMIARSEMAAVGAAIAITPGQVEGMSGDYSWRVRIEPDTQDVLPSSVLSSALVTVSVRASADGPDLITLKSLRLASAS